MFVRDVCIHLNAFFMLNPNMIRKILWILKKKITKFWPAFDIRMKGLTVPLHSTWPNDTKIKLLSSIPYTPKCRKLLHKLTPPNTRLMAWLFTPKTSLNHHGALTRSYVATTARARLAARFTLPCPNDFFFFKTLEHKLLTSKPGGTAQRWHFHFN